MACFFQINFLFFLIKPYCWKEKKSLVTWMFSSFSTAETGKTTGNFEIIAYCLKNSLFIWLRQLSYKTIESCCLKPIVLQLVHNSRHHTSNHSDTVHLAYKNLQNLGQLETKMLITHLSSEWSELSFKVYHAVAYKLMFFPKSVVMFSN